MKSSTVLPVVWVIIIALFFGGCSRAHVTGQGKGRRDDTTGPSASKGTIGLSVLTTTNPFFNVIADNIRAEAASEPLTGLGALSPGRLRLRGATLSSAAGEY